MIRNTLTSLCLASFVSACQVSPQGTPATDTPADDEPLTINVLSDAQVFSGANEEDRRRIIADTLYAGLQALDADRLLTPPDDSAHAYFMRALAYEPNNEIALEGLENIVLRYVEMARRETRRGLFEQAESLLDRARFVNAGHPSIAEAWAELQAEQESGDLIFVLDERELGNRSEAAIATLEDIARQARDNEAFFLITAPNDGLARWMFGVMREAVVGYRLRGNIELSSRASVRLRLPRESSD